MSTIEMRQKQQDFINALRSGTFKQGKNFLIKVDENGENKYCCLGVLCEVLKKDPRLAKKGGFEYPREEILAEVGLNKADARLLGKCNDNGFSFYIISGIIEDMFYSKDLEKANSEIELAKENG